MPKNEEVSVPPERGHSCPQQYPNIIARRCLTEQLGSRTLLRTGMSALRRATVTLLLGSLALAAHAESFQLPTANHALFEKGGEERFFVGTTGKPWTTGCFGCVRSEGWQMHEGLDIRCLQRDKYGEATDPIL